MEAAKRDLEVQIQRRRSISVQQKVPIEIWQKVFAIVCSSEGKGHSLHILGTPEGYVRMIPVRLSHVSSRWRDIIVNCPTLWASMRVDIFDETGSNYPDRTETLVKIFLQNSGTCPLDICIRIFADAPHANAWEALVSQMWRWERVSLFSKTASNSSDLFHHREFTFNALVSYSDYDCCFRPGEDNAKFLNALHQALKLTNAELKYLYPPTSLPYHQLTTLCFSVIYVDEIPDLLHAIEPSVNLRSLQLTFCLASLRSPPSSLLPGSRIVRLPSLRTLLINHAKDVSFFEGPASPLIAIFFSSLFLPTLSNLELKLAFSQRMHHIWPPSLLTMLSRSSPTLKHMKLVMTRQVDPPSTWEPLSVVLETVPHLTHFELYDRGPLCVIFDRVPNPLLSLISELRITSSRDRRNVLPNLEWLTIQPQSLLQTSVKDAVNEVLGVATSRSARELISVGEPICALKELRFLYYWPYCPSFNHEMEEVIEDLNRQGMKVVIKECSD